MILYVFSLLDTKAGYFNVPFHMPSRGQAIRTIMELGADMNTTVGRHPADFALYELATFDDQTGRYEQGPPNNLGLVVTFLQPTQPPLFDKEATQ